MKPLGSARKPSIGPSMAAAMGSPGDIWWPRGPLITPEAGVVAHVGWRNGAISVFAGGAWTPTGSPPQVGASGPIPPGAGPLTGVALYSQSGAHNFAGDFTVAVVAKRTATTGTYALPFVTGNGSVGYFGSIVNASGIAQAVFYPGAQVQTAAVDTVGNPFVLVFGRNGTGFYVKLSGGTANRSTLGSHTPGALAATIGSGLGGSTFPGVVYEVYSTTTPFTDAFASSIIAQVGSRMGRSLAWAPDSSSVTPGAVVALGDSITNGSLVATPYPTTLATNLGAGWSVLNAGVNNDQLSQMTTRWNSTYKGTGKKWVVLLGGVNDIISGGAISADAVINKLLPLYESILKDGARLVPVTLTPWSNHASWTAGRQTITEDVNNWIAWWCTTNNVPYVNAYDALRTGTALSAGYDTGDGIHPNQSGTDFLESLIEAAFP